MDSTSQDLLATLEARGFVHQTTDRDGLARAFAAAMPLYGASKAALNSLLQSWVAGCQPSFAVLALHPGWVQTELGGASAPVAISASVAGLMMVIESRAGQAGCAFLDYQGQALPW
ncbi:hypothetical protein [uncultured Pseudomonas sp.]|uniref:hypothetical protein n=1 Tax=uncultured Pseudomonas sp. TaxID=114707 RepID=UPI002600CA4C|nr:hypothetical protein [uncultured Pseudomonas sp.]